MYMVRCHQLHILSGYCFPIESRLCFFFEVTLVILLVIVVCYTVIVARLSNLTDTESNVLRLR